MPFESDAQTMLQESPSGHVIGIQGFNWGSPMPRGITFFLDGSAMVTDQYGRPIRGVVMEDGKPVLFAMQPPDATRDGPVTARPQYAPHAMVIAAMNNERVGWLLYEVRYANRQGGVRVEPNKTLAEAMKRQQALHAGGTVANGQVSVARQVVCAGWPQLPYEELKKLPPECLPYSPMDDLRTIPDLSLRKDALRVRREMEESRSAGMQLKDEE